MSASTWKVRATGGSGREPDRAEVRRALELLADPSAGIQLQAAPSWRYRTFAASQLDAACDWVADNADATGIYYGLNPVPSDLRDRVKVSNVLRRRWLLVDVDRDKTRDPDLSATEAEHEAAGQLASDVARHLGGLDWPEPLTVDSGNGFHLLYRIDLPNDKGSRAVVSAVLKALAGLFDGPRGTIGVECCDARRISKLPGTWSRRGHDTPERPHRMARLLHAPTAPQVVSLDQMLALAGLKVFEEQTPPQPEPKPSDRFTAKATGKEGAYAKAALERECAAVLNCPLQGGDYNGRNNQLNVSAMKLGQLVAGKLLTQDEVEAALYRAARGCGLVDDPGCGERGVWATIRSGMARGMQEPRTAPERNGAADKPVAEPIPDGVPLTVSLAEIQPLPVQWLMPSRIPKRFITIFAGRTGLGKSFVACDIVARISRGDPVPFFEGECFEQGGALLISEDSHEYVLAPRLAEMKADLASVRAMTWKAMSSYQLGDTAMLDRAAREVPNCKVVMIDPPTNFLSGADEHKNVEVRAVVMKVVEWAMQQDLAVVFILHVNKQHGKGTEALNRVLGSVAWVTTARIAHSFTPDPDDKSRCLFIPMKNNLGPLAKGLAYRIVTSGASARVEWLEEVDTTADDAMAGEKGKPRRVVASEWLIERFRERLEWPSDELFAAAANEGISRSAVFEAKAALNLPRARQVVHHSVGGDVTKTWVWWVPEDWPPLHQIAATKEAAVF